MGPVPVRTLLIVEDDITASQALAKIVETKGVVVTQSHNLKEALEGLENDKCPDMVLLDLGLPDGSGVDYLRYLRERGCASRVVIMTGIDSGTLDAAKIWRYGVEIILSKPVKLHHLFYLMGI